VPARQVIAWAKPHYGTDAEPCPASDGAHKSAAVGSYQHTNGSREWKLLPHPRSDLFRTGTNSRMELLRPS